MARVFLSLGSNVGDRLANIQQAVSLLSMTNMIKIVKSSSFYETEPWGDKNLNWFVNAAVAIDTNLSPLELLKVCQNVEKQLGRNRDSEKRWSNRQIDIDILMYDDEVISIENVLIVPHPFMHKRAFVLVPMLEVKSDLLHPVFKKTISELYDDLEFPEDVFLYGTIIPKKQ